MDPIVPSLQQAVNRYSTSLVVPHRLEKLHPRERGYPGNAGALAPAIVLTSISAFEGFVEEFLALLSGHTGHSYAQTAKIVTMNNPTLRTFDDKLNNLLPDREGADWKSKFSIDVLKFPTPGRGWPRPFAIKWKQAAEQADSWMQVRHCLSHGLNTGIKPEVWPGPLRGTAQAKDVLRVRDKGKFSLSIAGAMSCNNIYRFGAERLADEAAASIGHDPLDWSGVKFFEI